MHDNTPKLPDNIDAQVRAALAEDLAGDIANGDLTAALVPADAAGSASLVCREAAVICGQPWVNAAFAAMDGGIKVEWLVTEGDKVEPDTVIARFSGPARALLTGERTALNFLQTLSGTATISRHYADIVAGTSCRILDTRKTIPGLRLAQKYAVAVGGASNHRIGLFDAILIKENHIAAAGSIAAAVKQGRERSPNVVLEVEVESLDELAAALAAGADVVMLDNFDLDTTRAAVQQRNAQNSATRLEASGNMDEKGLREVAEAGVDFVSIGALTKHVRAVDLSFRFTL
ncbi:MAG: carboxylating nicotinate-nucleotide diphosphorylase [Gammaproteobacteria bacterium]|nr:carboxylating nicotinate-nucleotide diphosphorylase [Gammaproteobacteria bacterium]